MVPDLVRHDIGVGEVAAAAEPPAHLLEEDRVEIDLLVGRAVERAHRRLRRAAAGAVDAPEEHEARRAVLLAGVAGQHALPDVLVLRQHGGEEAAHLVGWRRACLRLLRRRARALQHLRPADQDARIDAERVADEAEHDHGAEADAPAAARHAGEASAGAPVLDVLGLAIVVPPHCLSLP